MLSPICVIISNNEKEKRVGVGGRQKVNYKIVINSVDEGCN